MTEVVTGTQQATTDDFLSVGRQNYGHVLVKGLDWRSGYAIPAQHSGKEPRQMPNPMPLTDEPHLLVRLSNTNGQMQYWSMAAGFSLDEREYLNKRVRIWQEGRQTCISIYSSRERPDFANPTIRVMGFRRAMVKLSTLLNRRVRVYTDSTWSISERARTMLGVYGDHTPPPPPPPPVVATPHPVNVLRAAYAEYAARVRGEATGYRFGYCNVSDDCSGVAAGMVEIEGKHYAACKRHTAIDPDVLNGALDLVRRNGRVFVAEAKSFGIPREAFARLVADKHAELIKDGPMTRWVPARIAADADDAATFRRGQGKHKHLNHRRGRKF